MAREPDGPLWCVERLTLWQWFLFIAPRLIGARLRGRAGRRCDVIDVSRPVLAIARGVGRVIGVSVERLPFRLLDIRDDAGLLVEERIRFFDLWEANAAALASPVGQVVHRVGQANPLLRTYLMKGIAQDVRRLVYIIQVCLWQRARLGHRGPVVLFAHRRAWSTAASQYAATRGVLLRGVPGRLEWRRLAMSLVGPRGWQVLLGLRDWFSARRSSLTRSGRPCATTRPGAAGPRIGVAQYGCLHVQRPELNSDLFMWQQSSLAGEDLVLLLHRPVEPEDHEALIAAGISAVAANREATIGSPWPCALNGAGALRRLPHADGDGPLEAAGTGAEARWLGRQCGAYRLQRAQWMRLFEQERIMIFCSWFRFDTEHCAIADAVRSLGGVSTIYQHAYASYPSPLTLVGADVLFSWSMANADIERRSGVAIPYHVATGYLGDHRVALLRPQAQRIRMQLERNGARRILAFLDENSKPDPRWHTGHELQREGYAYLLERLLEEPWLGLVIKPKVPGDLRQRLGSVAPLLERAEATGRCYIYGTYHEAHTSPPIAAAPPPAAVLAADVAVHGCLAGGTASVEAALTGVPTLAVDREGWPVSPFYRLGIGRVVFTDWPSLWQGCLEHWSRPGGVPGFGDWSPLLDELDPFRDGRAAERMGTYLSWLLEGFRAGLPRKTVLADAAERYAAQWGKEKVVQIGGAAGDAWAGAQEPAPLVTQEAQGG